ncbi:MAG: hypothetical protein H6585_13315 [Flavobacteriales bacterium]|nr:hypothetical protein [Flavobacteriales bacterium]
MQQQHIPVEISARYFTLGDPAAAREAWFVLHGYAQLAPDFLAWFEPLQAPHRLIVAPEGLHRFYRKGFDGNVVASWMTREDRLTDIANYVHLLNSIYAHVMAQVQPDTQVVALGFSQGASTVCRWLANQSSPIDHLLLWAGVFPPDLPMEESRELLDRLRPHFFVGDEDPFFPESAIEQQQRFFETHEIPYRLHRFSGAHKVDADVLKGWAESHLTG